MSSHKAMTMRAERFYADSKKVAVDDVPIPEPGTGEMLIKVAFCGICHSDLSLINGTFPAQVPVVTQGHEASGTIAELGPDAATFQGPGPRCRCVNKNLAPFMLMRQQTWLCCHDGAGAMAQ